MKNKLLYLLLPLFIIFVLCGCNKKTKETKILENSSIFHDDEFGGAYIDISIEKFNKLGFSFGDSLNLYFTTDDKTVVYEDIGYYSGYYVPAGQELVVGYKGYSNIKFCINYGEDIYASNNFNTNTLVTIKVNKEAKYKAIEETLTISYLDDRNEYDSDEKFANFREIKVGNIKDGILYRGASPIDNTRKRAEIVDSLLSKNNIRYNIDLADKFENIYVDQKYLIGDYMQNLIANNKSIFLGMAAAYKADDFSGKMKKLCLMIINNDGPYYIHCLEGKDRTGYVCMVLEALCGASYDELIDDYFVTYKNYYGIEKDSEKYNVWG